MHPHQDKILNPEQEKAVHFGEGPLLIIAGAGTGKTTVITERIKHLIISGLAKPQEILALTFTEKAAREMEERVDLSMPYGYTQMWISTFHSFCDRMLRAEAVHIGLNPGYRLLSDADATMLVRKNLFQMQIEYFRPLGNPHKFISGMLAHFSRLKDEDISPIQYLEWAQNQKSRPRAGPPRAEKIPAKQDLASPDKNQNEGEKLESAKYQELARAYKYYEELKIKEGVMDFGDLITNVLILFRNRPNMLRKYQTQFRFVLVDEFQDTNIAQYELIKLLAPNQNKPNLTVVGDDNQSIYKFRGAAVSNILSFMKDYPQAKQVVLNQNYRSYQYILDKAYDLIKHNDPDTLEAKLGISKKLQSIRKGDGDIRVKFIHTDRVENEADMVAREIKKMVSVISNVSERSSEAFKNTALPRLDFSSASGRTRNDKDLYFWKDFAILVRANNHAEPFIRAFLRHAIPYQFLGPGQLFQQAEIKELIAYLSLLHNFEDNIACYRVLTMNCFGIPVRDLTALANFSKRYGLSLFEAGEVVVGDRKLEKVSLPFISNLALEKITHFVKMFVRHLGFIHKESAGQILFYFLEDTGMLKNILEYKTAIDERRATNITKFFNKLKTYESEHEDASVGAVLDWILLSMDLGESPVAADIDWTENDAVNILTVHASKGLEFPVVFLVNLVSQRFPTTERREQIPMPEELIKEELPQGDYHEEEERRLFYVGMTRARDRLYFTAADFYGEGKREKKISPFVFDALGEKGQTAKVNQAENQLLLLEWRKEAVKEATPKTHVVTFLSYSQIETYRICPLHYKLKYMLKIPTPPSAAQSFGVSVHSALKGFYELVKEKQKVDKSMLLSLLESNWVREGYGSRSYEAKMKDRGKKFLSEYFDKSFDPEVRPLLLEENFNVNIGYDRFLKIGGKIDRIDDAGDGKIEIIDYKTGRLPSQREVDTDLQLSMYAIAASEITSPPLGKRPEDIKLSLYFFDTQQKLTTTRTKEQLTTEKNRILDIAAEMEKSSYRCSGSKLCEHCEYKLFCGI